MNTEELRKMLADALARLEVLEATNEASKLYEGISTSEAQDEPAKHPNPSPGQPPTIPDKSPA